MRYKIVKALHQKYLGEIAEAEANVEIYLSNPAGIGEHPDVVAECGKLIKDVAEANEIKETVNKLIELSNQQNK